MSEAGYFIKKKRFVQLIDLKAENHWLLGGFLGYVTSWKGGLWVRGGDREPERGGVDCSFITIFLRELTEGS